MSSYPLADPVFYCRECINPLDLHYVAAVFEEVLHLLQRHGDATIQDAVTDIVFDRVLPSDCHGWKILVEDVETIEVFHVFQVYV